MSHRAFLLAIYVLQITAYQALVHSSRFRGRNHHFLSYGFRVQAPLLARPSQKNIEEEEVIEWDEDEFENTMSYDEYLGAFSDLAKATSKDAEAVSRAEKLFDNLYQTYLQEEDPQFLPGVEVYNWMLEIHAFSPFNDGADKVSAILDRMEASKPDDGIAQPDATSYGKLMDAWTTRRKLSDTAAVLDRMKVYGLKPDITIYNKLIKAYGKAGRADEALGILEDLMAAEDPDVFPNQKTWVQVLRAYSMKKYARDSLGVAKIQELMGRMARGFRHDGHLDWKPDIFAYNALLQAMSLQPKSHDETELVLQSVIEQYEAGEERLRPTPDSFYNVFMSYRGSKSPDTTVKVEKLLQLQSSLCKDENDSLRVTTRNYNACMSAMSRTHDALKSVKARAVLDRYRNDDDPELRPSEFTYVSILNACAYTLNGRAEDKMAAFQVALTTLKEVRQSKIVNPTEAMYALFLRASGNLMPSSPKRDKVVEAVFAECCTLNFTSDNVLRQFEITASEDLQRKVLGGFEADRFEAPLKSRET